MLAARHCLLVIYPSFSGASALLSYLQSQSVTALHPPTHLPTS